MTSHGLNGREIAFARQMETFNSVSSFFRVSLCKLVIIVKMAVFSVVSKILKDIFASCSPG